LSQTVSLKLQHSQINLGTDPSDDIESSITIFEALKGLDLVQANDKRLWVTLTHTLFYEYVRLRWNIGKLSSDDAIKDRFHFEGAALRQRNQNALARLWWGAKVTYNESLADPYELTRLLWEKQDFYQNLIDRKFSTYRGTLLGFLQFYSKNKHLDLKLEMRKLFKGINAYGGVKVLSLLKENEVEDEIQKLCKFYRIKKINP
jgi:hypothetical protein